MAPTYSIMMWQKLWWIDACRDAFVGLFVSLLLSMRVPTCRPSIYSQSGNFFPRTVLITTYLSSLQIPKENKSWVVFTSKKKSSALLFFFLLNLSPRISWGISNLGSTKKIQASSGVSLVDGSDGSDCGSDFQHEIWCALNFSVAKYLGKTIFKKENIWWEIVHKSVNLDSNM